MKERDTISSKISEREGGEASNIVRFRSFHKDHQATQKTPSNTRLTFEKNRMLENQAFQSEKEDHGCQLGHPANQVLKLLKGSLNLSNIDHEGPCEVCHKAKHTRDSFPLSENKSTVFGQLMHLDIWGPYKVISREGFRYFLTIVDDYSRLPSSVLNGKSPFSLVYNKEPNISHLRSFGCLCYVALIKGSDKFFEKSEKCVLIGYASDKKAYKLFSLENRNVLYSRDVKFYETIFPYKMSVQLDVEQEETESEVINLIFFDCVESDPKPITSISPNDDEEGSSCRDGSVHQSGPSHSLDQPEVDEQIPTSGSRSDLQGSGNDGLVTATPIDENTSSEGNVGFNDQVPIFQNIFQNQTEKVNLKKSSRTTKLPAKFNEYVLDNKVKYMLNRYANHTHLDSQSRSFISNLNKTLEPSSFEEASKDPNWISDMNDEMNALYENDTWYLVDLRFGRKPIGSKWVFKIKYKSDGEVDRYLLSLAVQNEWDIYQMDFNNAFLYGDMIEEVYMLPPLGFFDPSDKRVCTSKVEIAKFKDFLSNRFKIKDLGELKYFLGIEVLKVSGGLCLSQRKYCLELLHDFRLLACRPVLTPLPKKFILAHKETEKYKFLHMHAPLKSHFDIALRILKYLKLAPGFGVQFVKRQSGFDIKAFLDSDWAKCPVTKRSVSGYCVFVNGCLVLGKARSELPCSNLQQKLNIGQWQLAAMQIAANPVLHEKTKHFDLDVHFIRENVCSGLIKNVKVESKDNVADILNKALGSFQHGFLTKKFDLGFAHFSFVRFITKSDRCLSLCDRILLKGTIGFVFVSVNQHPCWGLIVFLYSLINKDFNHQGVVGWKLEENVPNDANYDVWLPLASVHEVNDRVKNSLYGYFIGKRLAFPVVEWFVRNNWEKYGQKKVTMMKGFFFFKSSSIEGVDLLPRDGPWMIREIHIFLNKWSPSMSLFKEELLCVPVWVKLNDVPLVAYTSDGLSLIATKLGTRYTKETIHVEYEWKPPCCSTCLLFGHSLDNSQKVASKRVENRMDNEKGQITGLMMKGELVLVDDNEKPLDKVDYPDNSDCDDEVERVENKIASFLASKGVEYGPKSLWEQWRDRTVYDEYNPYDDDMYEGREISENIQTICDNFDIKRRYGLTYENENRDVVEAMDLILLAYTLKPLDSDSVIVP
nr:ribonuclease H-like domain-containing protein [Tanacetum cinerariifolium]